MINWEERAGYYITPLRPSEEEVVCGIRVGPTQNVIEYLQCGHFCAKGLITGHQCCVCFRNPIKTWCHICREEKKCTT